MTSRPPINSPFTMSCGNVGQLFTTFNPMVIQWTSDRIISVMILWYHEIGKRFGLALSDAFIRVNVEIRVWNISFFQDSHELAGETTSGTIWCPLHKQYSLVHFHQLIQASGQLFRRFHCCALFLRVSQWRSWCLGSVRQCSRPCSAVRCQGRFESIGVSTCNALEKGMTLDLRKK